MNCQNCRNSINSRKDITIGYLWSYSWVNVMPPIALYHKKCFEEVKSKTTGFVTPASVDLNKLNSIKIMSYIFIFIPIFIIIYVFVALYLKSGTINWAKFFDIGALGYLSIILGIIVFVAIFYFPARDLVIIRQVEKLK